MLKIFFKEISKLLEKKHGILHKTKKMLQEKREQTTKNRGKGNKKGTYCPVRVTQVNFPNL